MLPVATAEYAGARGNLGAAAWPAAVVLAQFVGRRHRWLDGGRQCGDGGAIGLSVWLFRTSCAAFKPDHRVLLPGCALAVGHRPVITDVVARLALASAELPIGVVTATLGRQCLSGCYSNCQRIGKTTAFIIRSL